jgi:hypothetical protein
VRSRSDAHIFLRTQILPVLEVDYKATRAGRTKVLKSLSERTTGSQRVDARVLPQICRLAATVVLPAFGFLLAFMPEMLVRALGDHARNRGIHCQPQAIPPHLARKVSPGSRTTDPNWHGLATVSLGSILPATVERCAGGELSAVVLGRGWSDRAEAAEERAPPGRRRCLCLLWEANGTMVGEYLLAGSGRRWGDRNMFHGYRGRV